MKEVKYAVGDVIHPYGRITRVSQHYVWFGSKRYKHHTLKNQDVTFHRSPNTIVDWSNEEEVDNYYKSFEQWNTYIKNGDRPVATGIFKIENNKILHNGKYYLPYKNVLGESRKEFYNDGYIYGSLFRRKNAWYDHMEGEYINLFVVAKLLSADILDTHAKKKELKEKLPIEGYLTSIDSQHITHEELTMYKSNLYRIFKYLKLLPYKSSHGKPVTFTFSDSLQRIMVKHRNRLGIIEVDNSYHGYMPFSENYRLILRISPVFTNEARYYFSIYSKDITWDKNMLSVIANGVVSLWGMAIENNTKHYH